MSLISLQNSSELEVTILSNRFIDNFMPRANGEFVKVYIYLLRAVSSSPSSFSLEHMADRLFCTERDIFRALKYWEGEKILSLTYTTDRQLSGITLLEPFADAGHMESSASSENIFSTAGTSSSPVSAQMAAGISQPVALTGSAPKNVSLSSSNSAVSGGTSSELSTSADYIRSLTPDHISELKQNEEVSQLLYIAEQYLAKTLTPTEMQKIFSSTMSSICPQTLLNIWWNTVFPGAARACVISKLLPLPGPGTVSLQLKWPVMPAPVFPKIITRS